MDKTNRKNPSLKMLKGFGDYIVNYQNSIVNDYTFNQLMDKEDEEELKAFLRDFIKFFRKRLIDSNYLK